MRLILANAAVYLLQLSLPQGVWQQFAFVPAALLQRPWTAVTYMFLHGGFMHILFNMWIFYLFGRRLELRLGARQFLTLYFIGGISGAVLSSILGLALGVVPIYIPIIGASGAVFGIELAYAMYWPRDKIWIWGVLPVEVRWLVIFLTGLSLFAGFSGARDGVAHFAHLGGFAGAFLYLKFIEWRSPARRFKRAAAPLKSKGGPADVQRWQSIRRDGLHHVNRDELDRILDKIGAKGLASLTAEEQAFLERFSGGH
jgi:membrane associated rhomboid family serine protease